MPYTVAVGGSNAGCTRAPSFVAVVFWTCDKAPRRRDQRTADLLLLGSSEREFFARYSGVLIVVPAATVRSPQPWVFSANGRKPKIVGTTRTTISFSQRYKLRDLDYIQPAGDYLLDTDEELIESLSRLAYRRVATLLHLNVSSARSHRGAVGQHCGTRCGTGKRSN